MCSDSLICLDLDTRCLFKTWDFGRVDCRDIYLSCLKCNDSGVCICYDKDINLTSVIMPLHDTFVANKNYAALAEDVQPLKSMHDYPLLMLDQNTVTRKAIINFSHSIGVHLHPEVECGSLELMIQLAKNGVGIACVPKEYVRRELNDDKTLFEIKTEPALPARSIGIAFPKNQPISYATKEFFKLFNKDN